MNAGSRVALFVTCMVDAMFQEVGKATMHLLERLGYDGDGRCARRVAARCTRTLGTPTTPYRWSDQFADVFGGYDALVAPSGSCVGSVRHQHAALADRVGDPELAARVRTVAERTYELSEFLLDVHGSADVGA